TEGRRDRRRRGAVRRARDPERRRVTPPRDPVAAVTHSDPYPYYADLAARRPLYRADALGVWVASSAAAVTAVLTSDPCRVRPTAEVVGSLLGAAPNTLPSIARWTDDFVRCLAPGARPEQLERGKAAAGHLLDIGRSLTTAGGLFTTLDHAARAEADAIVANG